MTDAPKSQPIYFCTGGGCRQHVVGLSKAKREGWTNLNGDALCKIHSTMKEQTDG
jgi:hypothetical protein